MFAITGKVGTKSITKYVEVDVPNFPVACNTTMKDICQELVQCGFREEDVVFTQNHCWV